MYTFRKIWRNITKGSLVIENGDRVGTLYLCPHNTDYCIRQKSDVFDTFKKWKALAENETRKRLKCLRSDNGGENCSKEFDSYCSHNGIHREKTVPRTPQENGVSERMNITIMEHARCMRLHVGFPLQFWEDVVNSIVYLINKGSSRDLDGGIPEEAWACKQVKYLSVSNMIIEVDTATRSLIVFVHRM